MGLLKTTDPDNETVPSVSLCETVQNKYLQVTDYIDDACMQGTIDYYVARQLKHEMFHWASFQTAILLRMDELEDEAICRDNEKPNKSHKHADTPRPLRDNHTHIQYDYEKHQSPDTNRSTTQLEYDTTKCKRYIKPVRFVYGGSTHDTNTKENETKTTETDKQQCESNQNITPINNIQNKNETEDSLKNTYVNETSYDETEVGNCQYIEPIHTSNTTTGDATQNVDEVKATIYNELESNLRMSRLENKDTFQTALRLVIRCGYPNGDKICFPTTEQTDRMVLRSQNLPTDHKDLLRLLGEACLRRNEGLDLKNVYKDFVKAHGRVYFDPKETAPKCFAYIKYPI